MMKILGPGGRQQNVMLFLREPQASAAMPGSAEAAAHFWKGFPNGDKTRRWTEKGAGYGFDGKGTD